VIAVGSKAVFDMVEEIVVDTLRNLAGGIVGVNVFWSVRLRFGGSFRVCFLCVKEEFKGGCVVILVMIAAWS